MPLSASAATARTIACPTASTTDGSLSLTASLLNTLSAATFFGVKTTSSPVG
jgi:hypothetical protein